MSILTWLRNRRAPQNPEPPRTLPAPLRINLADIQRHDGHFVVVPEWSSLSPIPPSWEIPAEAPQMAWIDSLVAAHAEHGTLDGLVPDLLDRLVSFKMEELRTDIDDAHAEGEKLIQRLFEQARMAERALTYEINRWRDKLAEAEVGYARAYTELTWELPPRATRVEDDAVAPAQDESSPEDHPVTPADAA